MRDIGKNIRALRTRADMSQDELAEKLFVTRQTVSNYENGKSRPDVEMLLRIAEVLGADMNAVLYGAEIPDAVKRERRREVKRMIVTGTVVLVLAAALWILTPIAAYLRNNTYTVGLYEFVKLLLRPAVFFAAGYGAVQGMMLLLPQKPAVEWGKYVRIGVLAVLGLYAVWSVPVTVWALLPREVGGSSFPPVYIPGYTELLFPVMNIALRYSWGFLLPGAAWRFFSPPAKVPEEIPAERENGE